MKRKRFYFENDICKPCGEIQDSDCNPVIRIKYQERRRCQEPDCKSSALGKTNYCSAHGGGKRCQEPDCKSGAAGKTK